MFIFMRLIWLYVLMEIVADKRNEHHIDPEGPAKNNKYFFLKKEIPIEKVYIYRNFHNFVSKDQSI